MHFKLVSNSNLLIKFGDHNWNGLEEQDTSKTLSSHNSKRGRKNKKSDMVAKLEKSRQSARECRARKKLRYQYLEDLVQKSETAVNTLKKELEMVKITTL